MAQDDEMPGAQATKSARTNGLRRRFWVEAAGGGLTGFLFLLTLLWRDWIEAVFGVDPDHGNGSAEWIAVVVLGVLTIALSILARLEWRSSQRALA